jgi:hypothetical protein
VPRLQTSWRWLALTVVVLQFALPFAVLLSRSIKRNPRPLGGLAVTLLVAQLLFVCYLVFPATKPAGFDISWWNALLAIVIVGLWLSAWRHNLLRIA